MTTISYTPDQALTWLLSPPLTQHPDFSRRLTVGGVSGWGGGAKLSASQVSDGTNLLPPIGAGLFYMLGAQEISGVFSCGTGSRWGGGVKSRWAESQFSYVCRKASALAPARGSKSFVPSKRQQFWPTENLNLVAQNTVPIPWHPPNLPFLRGPLALKKTRLRPFCKRGLWCSARGQDKNSSCPSNLWQKSWSAGGTTMIFPFLFFP